MVYGQSSNALYHTKATVTLWDSQRLLACGGHVEVLDSIYRALRECQGTTPWRNRNTHSVLVSAFKLPRSLFKLSEKLYCTRYSHVLGVTHIYGGGVFDKSQHIWLNRNLCPILSVFTIGHCSAQNHYSSNTSSILPRLLLPPVCLNAIYQ